MAKLNAFQKAIQGKSGQALADATKAFFGTIDESLIPAGSTVTYRSPDGARVEYTDADGYTHVLQRNLDATKANLGTVSESTNRPAVVTPKSVSGLLDQLATTVSSQKGLGDLSDRELQLLSDITNAQQQQLNKTFSEGQGTLTANLYGRGIENSTTGNQFAADLLQSQGLVQSQANADAANRELAARQFVSNQNAQLLSQLYGTNVQAQSASGQIATQQQAQQNDLFKYLNDLQLQRDMYEYQTNKSPVGSILGGLASTALNLFAPGAGSILSGAIGLGSATNQVGNSAQNAVLNVGNILGKG